LCGLRIVAIIQARMGSTRLPGKVLLDIFGQTMLSRVVNRVRQAASLDEVIVATSDANSDDKIEQACRELHVNVFRGNEADVLDRFYQASLFCKADVIVRITADCPLIEPTIIDEVVSAFLGSNVDYASNVLVRTYPRGLDVEVMNFSALATAWQKADKAYQRAHVTPYFYENANFFNLLSITGSLDYSCYRWTVDTDEDMQFIRRVYRALGRDDFDWLDVIELCKKEPELTELNRQIKQKELEKG
jgi:spore coat polysaccharide biosynthesis protein SpsF